MVEEEKMNLYFSVDDVMIQNSRAGIFKNLRFAGSANTYIINVETWVYNYTTQLGDHFFKNHAMRKRKLPENEIRPIVFFKPELVSMKLNEDYAAEVELALDLINGRGDLLYRMKATGNSKSQGGKLGGAFVAKRMIRNSFERAFQDLYANLAEQFRTTVQRKQLIPGDHCRPKCWDLRLKDGRTFRFTKTIIKGRTLEAIFLNGTTKTFQMSSLEGMEASE